MVQSNTSTLFEAAAGSGKTTKLAELALAASGKRILFTTYTDENTEEIGASLLRLSGIPPRNIDLMPWFTFLLRHCVKPFLWHAGFGLDSVSGVLLVSNQSAQRTSKDSLGHYMTPNGKVYTDKLSELALRINERTHGAVLKRISDIYDCCFIDEAQDLSGYDLELIESMLKFGMRLTMAADQRQSTYHTNNSSKNKKYRELGLSRFLKDRRLTDLCTIDNQSLAGCYRCNQQILDIANKLYPSFPAANSVRSERGEDIALPPVHIVLSEDIERYVETWRPVVLRSDAKTLVPEEYLPQNFGASKGRTYDRVLIYLTGPIQKWLNNQQEDMRPQTRAKFYVALTRARYSIGFVGDRRLSEKAGLPVWEPL